MVASGGLGVVGVGADLVDIERLRRALTRRAQLEERLFSEGEREYALRQRDPAKSLAARFGAKEAVMKALGVGLWSFPLRDVEVVRVGLGPPSLHLAGGAAGLAAERGARAWLVSLSHTDTTAMAVAIALG